MTSRENDTAAEEAEAFIAPPLSTDPDELSVDLEGLILGSVDVSEALAKLRPSRELSLTITKLQEAEMWYSRVVAANLDNGGSA